MLGSGLGLAWTWSGAPVIEQVFGGAQLMGGLHEDAGSHLGSAPLVRGSLPPRAHAPLVVRALAFVGFWASVLVAPVGAALVSVLVFGSSVAWLIHFAREIAAKGLYT